jgi:hypothetical protein
MLQAQAKYFAQREAGNQTAACGNSFPPSADDQYSKMLPAQARYFEQRKATLQARTLDVSAPRSC